MSDELQKIKDSKDEFKMAISHFYGEITRLNKGEQRKYTFPITKDSCMETLQQCYDYISKIEELQRIDPDSLEMLDIEMQTAAMMLTNIEAYSHVIENNKEPEILNEANAINVSSPMPRETKGRNNHKVKTILSSELKTKLTEDSLSETEPVSSKNAAEVTNEEIKQFTVPIHTAEYKPESIIYSEAEAIEENPLNAIDTMLINDKEAEETANKTVIQENISLNKPKNMFDVSELNENELIIDKPPEDDKLNIQVAGAGYEEEVITDSDLIKNDDTFIEDNDLDESGRGYNEELNDITIINNDDSEENNPESELYAFAHLPDTLAEHGIKAISRTKTNSFKSRLQKKTIDPSVIQNIKLFPYNPNDETLRKEYFSSHNDMIASPTISRIALLMSGYFVEISSYGNWDTTSLQRTIDNDTYDFVDKELALLNFIYDHIQYFSYTEGKPDFDSWLDTVRYPDYDSLFYGLYDAGAQGINNYLINCPFCGKERFTVSCENKELVVAVDRNYTDDDLTKFITTRDVFTIDGAAYLPKWANTTRVRAMPRNTKMLFEFAVPTLLDYVKVLNSARRIMIRDKKSIDLSKILSPGTDDYIRIMLYLYTKTIGLPSPVYGDPSRPKEPTSYRFIGLNNKADIIELINSLDIEDYTYLLQQPVVELFLKRSADYYIKDTKCPECGKNIKYIGLDPRRIFFFKIGEAVQKLTLF
jgi:hypothetical protein